MTSYAGLDVAQQETQVCVVDENGIVRWTGKVRTEPAVVAAALKRRAPDLERVVLESGALSGWLCCGLQDEGLPAVCIDARAAHGALKGRSKTERSDAEGLARLAQVGWFKLVRVKSRESRERRALLVARERLVRVQRDLMNQVRGLLKTVGLVLPRTTPRRLTARTLEWLDAHPGLRPAILPLLAARTSVAAELDWLEAAIVRMAAADPVCRRLATVPGVGAITAMSFVAVLDDPGRFARPDRAAAYLGLPLAVRRGRPSGRHLQGRQQHDAPPPLRGRQQPHRPREARLRPQGLGPPAPDPRRQQEGPRGARPPARRPHAQALDKRQRFRLGTRRRSSLKAFLQFSEVPTGTRAWASAR